MPGSRRRAGWRGPSRFCLPRGRGGPGRCLRCRVRPEGRRAPSCGARRRGWAGWRSVPRARERAGPRPPASVEQGVGESGTQEASVGGNRVVESGGLERRHGHLVADGWRSGTRTPRALLGAFVDGWGALRRGSRRASAQCRCPPERPAKLAGRRRRAVERLGCADVGTPLKHLLKAQESVAALGVVRHFGTAPGWLVGSVAGVNGVRGLDAACFSSAIRLASLKWSLARRPIRGRSCRTRCTRPFPHRG